MPKARNSAAAAKQLGPGEAARDITKPRDLPAGGNGQLSGDAQKGPGPHKQMHATSKEQQDLKMKTKKVSFAGQVSRDVAEVAVSSFNQQRSCRDTLQAVPKIKSEWILALVEAVQREQHVHGGVADVRLQQLWRQWWQHARPQQDAHQEGPSMRTAAVHLVSKHDGYSEMTKTQKRRMRRKRLMVPTC